MENPILIFGAKGLAYNALEIFRSNNVLVYGFLDDDTKLHNTEIDELTVLGSTDDEGFTKLIGKKCDAFVAIENTKIKKSLVDFLIEVRKVMPVNAIHQRAYVSKFSTIGHGNLISAGANVQANVNMGSHNHILSNAVIDHHVTIGNFVHIGAGANIGSDVTIEDEAFIGAGVTIISGVTIGKGASVGAGSVVMSHVKPKTKVFGVPAVEVK
jgi:sugar O-acyltransferase (sialic acid O-acetyltransferase NeuD family)